MGLFRTDFAMLLAYDGPELTLEEALAGIVGEGATFASGAPFAGTANWGQLLSLLFSLVLVVVAAIWVTRLVATQRMGGGSARNLRIVESLGLGGQTHLSIVKVGTKHVLVGITKEGINYLCDVDATELNLEQVANNSANQFAGLLNKYLKRENDLVGSNAVESDSAKPNTADSDSAKPNTIKDDTHDQN